MKRRRRYAHGNLQHKGESHMSQPINVPMALVAGFAFRLDLFAGADMSDYKVGAGDRIVILYLIGDIKHTFNGARADEFYTWYLALTGQNRIAPVGLKLT